MQFLVYFLFRCGILIVSILPKALTRLLERFLSFILRDVIGYRKKVININLKNSFPLFTEIELKKTIEAYYRHLGFIIIQTLRAYSFTPGQVMKNARFQNPEIFEDLYRKNESGLFLGGHIGLWELAGLTLGLFIKQPVWVVYKPIHNRYIDRYIRKARSKFNIELIDMNDIARKMKTKSERAPLVFMLADQYPAGKHTLSIPFFNIDTTWFIGPQILAHRYNMTPVYWEVMKDGQHWVINLETLEKENLMKQYVGKLQASVIKSDLKWLWSHKRWKNIKRFYEE